MTNEECMYEPRMSQHERLEVVVVHDHDNDHDRDDDYGDGGQE